MCLGYVAWVLRGLESSGGAGRVLRLRRLVEVAAELRERRERTVLGEVEAHRITS